MLEAPTPRKKAAVPTFALPVTKIQLLSQKCKNSLLDMVPVNITTFLAAPNPGPLFPWSSNLWGSEHVCLDVLEEAEAPQSHDCLLLSQTVELTSTGGIKPGP